MIYYKAKLKNPDNEAKIDEILDQMEVDVAEDPVQKNAQLLKQIKDLGEDDLYEELKGRE